MLITVVVPIVHVAACIFLIVVVLLQTGKGADMGAVFGGGGSQTLFGATGAGNLLTKLTTAMAVTFMATSLILATSRQTRPTSDLIERLPQPAAPVTPPPAPSPGAALPAPTPPPATGTEAQGTPAAGETGEAGAPAAETAPPPAGAAAPARPTADAPQAAADAAPGQPTAP